MPGSFLPEKDILILHRQNPVAKYMSPEAQAANPHFHYQYEMVLNVRGDADYCISGAMYHADPCSLLLMSNMENHYIVRHSVGYDRFTLRFSTELLAAFLRDPLLLSIFKQRPEGFSHLYLCEADEFEQYVHLARLMLEEYKEQQFYWDQMIASKLLTILISMYRRRPEVFPAHQSAESLGLIFGVQNYIESNLQEDLSLETVANQFFVNKYHLSHSFSKATGYTFKRFVVTARLSKAKDLLINTSDEINAISAQVGFGSVSHFIRSFRQMEGVSPLQYRNRARPKA